MPYEPIETNRLLLRPWQISDAEDLYAYARDPEVGPAAGWKPHQSLEESQRICEMFIREGDVWALVEKQSGRVIGSVGLHKDGKRGVPEGTAKMLGYVLSHAYWGKGYMTEAAQAAIRYGFDALGVKLISICHFPFNARSRRVIEKCGFTYEGTLRASFYRAYDDTLLDECVYSMTRAEYDLQPWKNA